MNQEPEERDEIIRMKEKQIQRKGNLTFDSTSNATEAVSTFHSAKVKGRGCGSQTFER